MGFVKLYKLLPFLSNFYAKRLFSGLCFVLRGSSIMKINWFAGTQIWPAISESYVPKYFQKEIGSLLKHFLSKANKHTLTFSTPAWNCQKLGDHFDAPLL